VEHAAPHLDSPDLARAKGFPDAIARHPGMPRIAMPWPAPAARWDVAGTATTSRSIPRTSGLRRSRHNPWVIEGCRAVLGPEYKIVELGFDVPNPGAQVQPWHRDFPAPPDTLVGRRLNSLAFNVTCVDVTEDMGPFEIAPGTQWDEPVGFEHEMFPPRSYYSRYLERAQRKMPQMGDISARSALTIHRGTANGSDKPRPALVLGVDAPTANNSERHELQFSREYYARLPEPLKAHLTCRVVDRLEPIVQAHSIEGLMMGDA
jgi:hypothetical protein